MADIDFRSLIERSKCLLCVPELTLEVLAVRLLSDILLLKNPMADVSKEALLARSGPFMTLSKQELLAIMVYLLTLTTEAVGNVVIYGAEALRDESYFHGKMVYLLWVAFEGDNSGGIYHFDEASALEHDGVSVIRPRPIGALDLGRWLRSPNPI